MTRGDGSGVSHHAQQWIPLRDDYFETPLLSAKEKAYLIRKSCEAAQEVVERARSTGGPIQWRHIEKYNDVQLYAGFSRGTYAAEPTSMCGVTSVPGTVKEVAQLFDLGTTRAMKDFGRAHPDLFYDAIVLYTLSPRCKEKPLHQVTAKWIAMPCPRDMDDRDFCYLECQDKFIDSSGRRGWVLCLHSIKLPGVDELSREFGFVRGSFYHSGLIVVEADRPGYVDIIHMLQINLKNNTKMPSALLRERIAFISRVKHLLRVKRMNEQRYLNDLELVPKKYRSRCNVCQDSFSLLLLRKMNCRKCGEVVCGACSKEFDVTNAKFLETVKLRICMHCYQMITAGQMATTMLDTVRPSTSLSLLGYHDDNQRASIITMPTQPGAAGGGGAGGGAGPTRESQQKPKIFLQSMRRPPQRRSTRRSHDQPLPAPLSSPATGRYSDDPRGTYALPPSSLASGDHNSFFGQYDYDNGTPRSFDAPAPPTPTTPASLFDRRSTRARLSDLQTPPPSRPAREPQHAHGRHHRDLGSFKIPATLNDGSGGGLVMAKKTRQRRGSTSSASSTDSIDIDSQDGDMPRRRRGGAKNPPQSSRDGDLCDESESSIGSETEDDDGHGPLPPFRQQKATGKAPVRTGYYSDHDEEEEEKKTEEFEQTPALPAPPPSAYASMEATLLSSGRESLEVPFKRRDLNITDMSINTVDCDTNFLDTGMRRFHEQPFFLRDRPTIDMGQANDSFLASPASTDPALEDLNLSPASQDVAFVAAPVLSAAEPHAQASTGTTHDGMMTSPVIKPQGDRPPLYGKPRKNPSAPPSSTTASSAPPSSERVIITEAKTSANAPTDHSEGGETRTGKEVAMVRSGGSTRFESNASMISTAPSTNSNEDLTFSVPSPSKSTPAIEEESGDGDRESTGNQVQETKAVATAVATSTASRPAPSYIPSRFQNRPSAATTRPKETKRSTGPDPVTLIRDHLETTSISNNQDDIDLLVRNLTRPSIRRDETVNMLNTQENDVLSGSDSEQDLLSARQLFRGFGDTYRLTRMVGDGDKNPTLLRDFEQIQESFQLMSDDESGDEHAL